MHYKGQVLKETKLKRKFPSVHVYGKVDPLMPIMDAHNFFSDP